MCRPTRCRTCGNTTWSGCGRHVDQVMAQVPRDRRCACPDDAAAESAERPSLISRLFER